MSSPASHRAGVRGGFIAKTHMQTLTVVKRRILTARKAEQKKIEFILRERLAAAVEVVNCGLFNIIQKDGTEHGYFVTNEKRDWFHAVKHRDEKAKPVDVMEVVEALAKARHEGCTVKFLN